MKLTEEQYQVWKKLNDKWWEELHRKSKQDTVIMCMIAFAFFIIYTLFCIWIGTTI